MRGLFRHGAVGTVVLGVVGGLLAAAPAFAASSWSTTTHLPAPRASLGAATLGTSIYAAGGYGVPSGGGPVTAMATVWAFTPGSGTWAARAAMPVARAEFALVATGGKLYAIGGRGASGSLLTEVDRYDPASNSWTPVAPLPTGVDGPPAAVGNNGDIYIPQEQPNSAGDAWVLHALVYDPSANTWTQTADTPTTYGGSLETAATGADGRIYAMGRGTSFAFNPSTGAWQPLAADIGERFQIGSTTTYARRAPNGRFYLVGGSGVDGTDNEPTGFTEVYNPATNQWTLGKEAPAQTADPATAMAGGKLYSIGGYQAAPWVIVDEVDVLSFADTQAPTVSTPSLLIDYFTQAYTTTVPVKLSFLPHDNTDVSGTHWQRAIDGGAYTDPQYPWWSSHMSIDDTGVRPGHSYRYRVAVTDDVGNVSAWQPSVQFSPAEVQETAPGLTYTGSWTSHSDSTANGGHWKSSATAGASVSYTFTGHDVGWVPGPCATPSCGVVKVIVDGVNHGTVDLTPYAPYGLAHYIAYTEAWPANGTHTIKLVQQSGSAGLDSFVTLR